jgi:hypothetical protein
MDVEITKLSGESFRLSERDITVRDFVVGSPTINPVYSQIEGRHGRVDMGATFGSRSISVPFYYKAEDIHGVALLRDELMGLAVSAEPFYIREMRRIIYGKGDNQYVSGKRYKVRLANPFEIDQQLEYGFGELRFETTDLPFAESIGTTADIDRDGITYDSELWSYGMGLLYSDEAQKYTHNTRSFRIYNAGNIPRHHPFEQELKITIRNASQGYQLSNKTTGDIFKFNDQPNGSIVIDGPVITDAGLIAFRKTNGHFITLAPGWNEFEQNQSATVSFDFRFYYL